MEVREPSSDLQQKSLETDSRTFVPHCSKCGMCRSHKFFNKLAPLHSQMFRELRRQLTTLYGDGPGKEVLVAGDALIRVSWRFGGRASSSSASSEDPLPDWRFWGQQVFLNRILSGLVFHDFFSVVILLQWRRANLFITGCNAVLFEAKAILKPHLGILIECHREDSAPNCLRVPETFRIQSTRCVLAELLEKSHNGDPCVWLEIIEYESCPRQVWAYAGSAWLMLSVNYIVWLLTVLRRLCPSIE